jgi:hypothetical protein
VVKINCPTDDEVESLAEVKATRDILEHNAGVVNDVYVRKAGKKARYSVGVRIDIDDAYHLESWRLIKKVVADLCTAPLELDQYHNRYWTNPGVILCHARVGLSPPSSKRNSYSN